jgi:hypothetical protein
MAELAKKMEELTVPEGGIADFIMEDEEAEAVYGPDSDGTKEFGDEGIAQFPALTKKMAAMGREGDDSIAHVETGELIIPAALIANNEELKELLFERMREYGIEDPERYVVGSDSNSINPETGAYEFFLKKIFKAIKKVVKSVVKVIKKIAPIVLPIVLAAFTPLGAVYGAALGSGIGTLINGGSLKDALKSALISGAIGGVTAGFTGPGTFGENVSAAFADPVGRIGQTVSGFGSTITGGGFTGEGNFFSDYVPTAQAEITGAQIDAGVQAADPNAPVDTGAGATEQQALAEAQQKAAESGAQGGAGGGEGGAGADRNFLQKTGDYMFRGGNSPADIAGAQSVAETKAITETLAKYGHTGTVATATDSVAAEAIAAGKAAAAGKAPSMLARFGPTFAAGTLAMGATGMFEVPEAEQASFIDYGPDGTPITGQDLIDADPSKFLISDLGRKRLNPETGEYEDVEVDLTVPAPDTSPYVVPTQYPITPPPGGYGVNNSAGYLLASNPGGPFARPYVTAAEGGPIFPRRNGGIAPTEGTPGKDSVRAMLMPGEFVMTTNAVRGLGNGNLNNGIKNMYSVMRNLERRGRAMS